jgi:hypothetical protein
LFLYFFFDFYFIIQTNIGKKEHGRTIRYNLSSYTLYTLNFLFLAPCFFVTLYLVPICLNSHHHYVFY